MKAGRLRHKITIEQPTPGTADEYGEQEPTWSTFATVWAEIQPLSGREYWQAAQVQSEVSHQVTIRWLPGVTHDMRVKFGTRYFAIDAIANLGERNEVLQLMCREAVA